MVRRALTPDADHAMPRKVEWDASSSERTPHTQRYRNALSKCALLSPSDHHRIFICLGVKAIWASERDDMLGKLMLI